MSLLRSKRVHRCQLHTSSPTNCSPNTAAATRQTSVSPGWLSDASVSPLVDVVGTDVAATTSEASPSSGVGVVVTA